MFKIKERLRPFSHLPGARCLIPGTSTEVVAYPTKLIVGGKELLLGVEGPLKTFTLMQDVERGCVTIFSEKYCMHIWPDGEVSEKKPPAGNPERLFLGCTKKQEWEEMKRRIDMCEIFPLWFQLGQKMEAKGSFSLLEECQEAVASHRPERIVPAFKRLFQVGFGGLMVPRRRDEDFQGICLDEVEGDTAILLSEGSRLIRSCFLEGEHLLPNLPPEFPAGKLCTDQIDIEWTKKQVRRVVVRSATEPTLIFPRAIKRYRVTKKGEMLYLLDRFEK